MKAVNKNELITAVYFSSLEKIANALRLDIPEDEKLGLPQHISMENVRYILGESEYKDVLTMATTAVGGEISNNGKNSLVSIATNVQIKGEDKGEPEEFAFSERCKSETSEPSELIEKLFSDLKQLKNVSEKQYPVSLDAVFENYTSTFGCGVTGLSDVSLWQYTKLKAALAEAFFVCKEKGMALTEKDELLRFVSGDASGIQKYIFNIRKNSRASKLLRAKSFQIWVQSLEVASLVAESFGVSYLSIISFSGGRFLMVVPNISESKELMFKNRKKVDEYFVSKYLGELSFILSDGVETSVNGIVENGLKLHTEISEDLNRYKNKKFQSILKSEENFKLDALYSDIQKKGGVCDFCGQHAASEQKDNSGNGERCCEFCGSLIDAGRKLAKSFDGDEHCICIIPGKISEKISDVFDSADLEDSVKFAVSSYVPGKGRLLIPYIVPTRDGDVVTFEELAELAEGNKKLAMFKADVDFLGLVFGVSLGENWSIARYAELSMRMHTFFADGLRSFVQARYHNSVYVVFSGGDDVCVIGPWDRILEFTEEFHNRFIVFTNHNPSLTLSAGISLFAPSTPVTTVVESAEEALDKSKQTQEKSTNKTSFKNSITVFSRTVSWEDFSQQRRDADIFRNLMLGEKAEQTRRGFVYGFLNYSNRAWNLNRGKMTAYNMLWQSHYAYNFARLLDRTEEMDGKVLEFLSGFKSNPDKMILSRIAVSIAVNKERKEEFHE